MRTMRRIITFQVWRMLGDYEYVETGATCWGGRAGCCQQLGSQDKRLDHMLILGAAHQPTYTQHRPQHLARLA